MNQLITYLTFNGNCREAMSFYQMCLGGQLDLQSMKDTPRAGTIPSGMKGIIVRATLRKEHMVLMGTDLINDTLQRGNCVSILLETVDEGMIFRCYHLLSDAGNINYPLTKNHWGVWSGGLTDKYGNHWLFHCPS